MAVTLAGAAGPGGFGQQQQQYSFRSAEDAARFALLTAQGALPQTQSGTLTD